MRKINKIKEVVDWGLCVGCGACYAICRNKNAVKLENISSIGIRPRFKTDICDGCNECLSVCPGYRIDAKINHDSKSMKSRPNLLIGPTYSIWEGFASDNEMRYNASSGGIISALAAFCIEKEKMALVIHTGMDQQRPWMNKTIISKSRKEIMQNAGSRYASSSPCELLEIIEKSENPCVFIGKPCDAAAISMARKKRPQIDKNLGIVLSFFCAGTPCSEATIDLVREIGITPEYVNSIRYRGLGWPGSFRIQYDKCHKEKKLSYAESWGKVSSRRPFRCHLCPDGLGELSDITSGDAWNKYSVNVKNLGISHVLVRSERGQEIIEKAIKEKYVNLVPSTADQVILAQGLVNRRKKVFGRQLALRILGAPSTEFKNFNLLQAWLRSSPVTMIKTIIGTMRRVIQRGLWHKNPIC